MRTGPGPKRSLRLCAIPTVRDALALARQLVHRRLGPGNDGNAEGLQGRGLTACRAPRRSP